MKTYDQIILETIKVNQPLTIRELAKKLGYGESHRIWHMINSLVKKNLILKDSTHKPYKYTINEVNLK